jgi:hypothetical protein
LANNVFQVKRTSTSGRTPNTTGSYATNSQYIAAGEFALNMADGILYTSNGSAVITVGSNLVNQRITNSISIDNNKSLRFQTINTSAYAALRQQNDDNFVLYTTNTAYGERAVWSIFANSITSAFTISAPTQLNSWINLNSQAFYANGSAGSSGQVLTSNGSATYWTTVTATVNTSAQYTWTNLHTFQANVAFTGNNISLVTNTGSILFNSSTDQNWKIGRNTGGTTKFFYTNNSLDIIAANSALEGIAFGFTGNSYLETGYAGTFTRNPIYIGNASVNLAINSTSIAGNTVIVGSPNTAVFYNYNGQVNASAGAFLSNAYAAFGGYGGNYLALGQQTNFHQWLQSGFSSSGSPVYYSIILNPLGGNVGIGNTTPVHRLSINGDAFVNTSITVGNATVNVTINSTSFTGTASNASLLNNKTEGNLNVNNATTAYGKTEGNLNVNNATTAYSKAESALNVNSALTANNSTNLGGQAASYYTNATNITTGTLPYAQIPANVINTTAAFTRTGITTFNANVVLGSSGLSANGGFGTAGQVLHSNGTATYWAADENAGGTVTSVASGNGITGGTITTTGTLTAVAGAGVVVNTSGINVLANNGITANSTGTFVNAQTPLVANATGLHIATSAGNGTFSSGISAITVDSVGRVTSVTGSAGYVTSSGVTSVATGNGMTGGTITTTGTVSILANTGIVANSTGAFVNATYISTLTANNANNLGGVLAASYVQNTDSRTLSGNLVISGTSFTPSSNTILLGNSTQRWVLSANTGSFSGAVSGITTLAAGNTTITGFANVTSTIQGGSSLTIAGALSGVTTAAMGNTTITGFANVTTSVNSALLTVGSTFIANTSQLTTTVPFSANGATGTAGHVLTSNGATGSPYWAAAAGGGYYKGGTSAVGSLAVGGQNLFRVNANTLNTSTTFVAGENGSATGPITIASGITLTIQTGARVSIV